MDESFIVSISPAKPRALRLLAPQRGLIAIGQNQNWEPFIVRSLVKLVVVVIPACLSGRQAKAGIQLFSGFRVAFHLPGMTILHSRNWQTLGVPRQSRRFT
jgi:hypothetical protein